MKTILTHTALAINATFLSFALFAQEYELRKVSELHIESLAKAGIRDYDPNRNIYAGYIDKGSMGVELATFNSEGEILESKNRRGEGPEDYVMSALTMGFASDGNIWVQTSMELLKYDLEFDLIDKVRFEPKITTQIYSGPRSKFIELTKSNDPSFVVNIPNSSNIATNEYIPSNLYMIDYYDAVKDSIHSNILLSSRNGFKGIEDEEFPFAVNSVFTADAKKNELYLTASLDNEITVYNPINWHIIKRIPVKHESFQPLDDIPIRKSNLPSINSMGRPGLFAMNRNLFVFESNMVGLVYVKDISEATYERRKSEGKPNRFNDPEFHRLIFFKDGIQLPGEHTVTSGLIEMALPNNRLLVKVTNLEEELDYIPFEIWEIVEK